MAKSDIFHFPVKTFWSLCGAFPVRRGYGDEAAFVTARSVLAAGGAVLIYCEGTRSRDGSLAARPRTGIGRLALETGAPVVPVAINETHRIREWRKGSIPRVRVQYGQARTYDRLEAPSREQTMVVAHDIFGRIGDLHRASKVQEDSRGG
jgi:1-acyl-sn-glycerol-3-phosphate acyltransferase